MASEEGILIIWDLQRIVNLDFLAYGCHWVRDDLINPEVESGETPGLLRERHLCDGVQDLTREFHFMVLNYTKMFMRKF